VWDVTGTTHNALLQIAAGISVVGTHFKACVMSWLLRSYFRQTKAKAKAKGRGKARWSCELISG
jgi:hypothetical protein